MAIAVRRFDDPGEFLAHAGDFLFSKEAMNTVPISALGRLRRGTESERREGYLATVERGAEIVLAAVRVPRLNLTLTTADDVSAIEPLADDIARAQQPPGVFGPADLSHPFATAWAQRTGGHFDVALRMRLFACEEVVPPTGVPGRLRRATREDRELLIDWRGAFIAEAVPHQASDRQGIAEAVDRILDAPQPSVRLWEVDGQPVSMAVHTSEELASPRIAGVYTPPPLRRHGYAGACVAALTGDLLAAGHRQALLYTDLDNPTSNRVYSNIGYRPVSDYTDHTFS